MALDPSLFRGMSPGAMALALTLNDAITRKQAAQKAGATCLTCTDTGLTHGTFCGCQSGSRLALQSYSKNP